MGKAEMTIFKIYDTDDFVVCKFVYQDDVLLECWRRLDDGSEWNLLEHSRLFAYSCFYEGEECSKEFYDEYGKEFHGFTNSQIDDFREKLGIVLRHLKDSSGNPLMSEEEVCGYMYYTNGNLADVMRYHSPESWAEMITM